MARYVLFLSAISGVCGIGYELLLLRWLHTAVGHTVAVSAATVTTFLAGIALGALVAHRAAPRLGAIEAVGAATAAAIAAFIATCGVDGLTRLVAPSGTPGAIAAAVLIALPLATISGVAVPAYAKRLSAAAGQARARAFLAVYVAYNALSALGAILIETAFVPEVGLAAAFAVLACVNLALALAAGRLPRGAPTAETGPEPGRAAAAALVVAGVGSGLGQVGAIKLANLLYGHHAEHAAFAIALALLGLSAGALAARRPNHGTWILAGLCLASLAAWWRAPEIWAAVAPALAGAHPGALVAAKTALIAAVVLPFMTAVGAGIPLALARAGGGDATPGRLVALAALGNVIGALGAVVGAHAVFGVAGLIAAGLLGAAAALTLARAPAAAGVAAVAALAAPSLQSAELHLPAYQYVYPGAAESPETIEIRRAWDRTVARLDLADRHRIVIEGRDVMTLNHDLIGRGEYLKGLFALAYARGRDDALVIGLGSSHTAAPVVAGFGKVVIVDNSPAPRLLNDLIAPEVRRPFTERPPEIVLDDAVAFLRADRRRYDAIVHTGSQGTSPSVKLWAAETIRAMAARLKPDGIFVTWVSGFSHPREALPASVAALGEVFRACRMVRMSAATYHALVCRKDGRPLAAGAFEVPGSIRPTLEKLGIAPASAPRLVRNLDRGRVPLFRGHPPTRLDPPRTERIMARRDFFAGGPTSDAASAWLALGSARTPAQCRAEVRIDPESDCVDRLFLADPCSDARADVLDALAGTATADGDVVRMLAAIAELDAAGRTTLARAHAAHAAREIDGLAAADPDALANLRTTPLEQAAPLLARLGVDPRRAHEILHAGASAGSCGGAVRQGPPPGLPPGFRPPR